jgi:carbon starvation protein CstA
VVDPLGGINTLWPLFGIANQMLAGIALMLCTVVLFKMKRDRYAWVTVVPTIWLLICTTYAGLIKIFDSNPAIGFVAQAKKYQLAIADGQLLGTAKSMAQMQQVVVNSYINAGLTALFLFVVFSVLVYALRAIAKARASSTRTDRETPYVALTDEQQKAWL